MQLTKILLSVCLIVSSQWAFAAGATKVGILDLQTVVMASDAGKAGMAELEKNAEYNSLKAKLDNLEAELKTLDSQAKNEGLTWGESKQSEHRQKMSEVAQERQQAIATLNRARESVFMQLLGAMEPGIGMALEEVMSAEGIEVILDSKAVIHKMPTADLTSMVVTKLNKINADAAENAKSAGKSKKQ